MKTICTVVIGHVDHGKTALVHALTGIETDRLPEEKQRGLSIKSGFAYRSYESGTIDFVDAPGHEDFVQAMISGASGASAALIVISATEGIAAQTLEHLRIAQLLGITRAVIAVTKSDLILPATRDAVAQNIRLGLQETSFADAPIVMVSAKTGDAIDLLHSALETLLFETLPVSKPLCGYLPIDRVFTLPGHGTIVTGTLLGRTARLGDVATIQPGDHPVMLRGLQSRGQSRDQITPQERMAANLRGVAAADVARGAVLCLGDGQTSTTCIDGYFGWLSGQSRRPKHMDNLRVHFGTSTEVAQLRLFTSNKAAQTGFAQLRFQKPVMAFAGQRAVIRALSPAQTLGGITFLDPQAAPTGMGNSHRIDVLNAAQSRDLQKLALCLACANGGAVELSQIARLARMMPDTASEQLKETFENIDAQWVAPRFEIADAKAKLVAALEKFHQSQPLRFMAQKSDMHPPTMPVRVFKHVTKTLDSDGILRHQNNMLALKGHDPRAALTDVQRERLSEIAMSFERAGLDTGQAERLLTEPTERDLLDLLLHDGTLLALPNVALNQTLFFHKSTLERAAHDLAEAYQHAHGFTTSQARAALGTTRRIIVPVLEHFDTTKITRREGNLRHMVPGN
jgi:selenocysteine-specific elongation factor